MKRTTYLLLVLWSFFVAGAAASQAQEVGVIWNFPSNPDEARDQLQLFDETGVTYLEIRLPVNQLVLDVLSDYDFNVFIRAEHQNLIISDVQSHATSLINQYATLAAKFQTHFNVQSIGLFTNSQFYHSEFKAAFSPVLDSLYNRFNTDFYYYQSGKWYDFQQPDISFAEEFPYKEFHRADLLELDTFFNSESFDEIIFLHSNWLMEAVNDYPELKSSLISYKQNQDWLLPLPDVSKQERKFNLPVLVLLLLWLGLALLLRLNPISRPMIMRYLLSHRFFADDILHYRERSASAGLALLIFHSIFSGLAFWVLSKVLLSETGIAAFFHHLPALAVTGRYYISFFIWGMILAAIFPFISLLWLHFSTKKLQHFSQTINLYSGIFALDFILVTAILTFYLAGMGNQIILILAFFFFLCWIAAFYIAAADVAKSMMVGKFIYLMITMGIHSIVLVLVVLAFLSADHLRQVINLTLVL